jgi:multicomponent K+:H+ antiporter subunit G
MNPVQLPLWGEIVVSAFVVAGSLLTLIGCVGLLRLKTFYQRVHAPTLGSTFGMLLTLLGSIVYFTLAGGVPAPHEILISVFLTMTVPASLLILARAALYRQRRMADIPKDAPEDTSTQE